MSATPSVVPGSGVQWELECLPPALRALSDTVLREGWILYPFRLSSLKNVRRFDLGVLFPADYRAAHPEEPECVRIEFLVRTGAGPAAPLALALRYLRPRAGVDPVIACATSTFELPREAQGELSRVGRDASDGCAPLEWRSTLAWMHVGAFARVAWEVRLVGSPAPGPAPSRDEALLHALAGVQLLVHDPRGGRLVSVTEPPPEAVVAGADLRQEVLWPALVGATLLGAPLILPDQARLAPETRGDHCDLTEISELLELRAQTLTEAEREEIARGEGLGARIVAAARAPELARGQRVRIRPTSGADALDTLLTGRIAIVEDTEVDLEGRRHVVVTLEDDPGADLGRAGYHGHRFFFAAGELDVL